MGPQFFRLPVLLVLAYIGMGYASWVLGLSILGNIGRPFSRGHVVILLLISSFIMVAWDLASDPIWANVARAWAGQTAALFLVCRLATFWAGI